MYIIPLVLTYFFIFFIELEGGGTQDFKPVEPKYIKKKKTVNGYLYNIKKIINTQYYCLKIH